MMPVVLIVVLLAAGCARSAAPPPAPAPTPSGSTALRTRTAPLAIYVARLHRVIHPRWAEAFLVELDRRPASDPLNDPSLFTVVELAIASDGAVAEATVVTASGQPDFDAAALDAVRGANPEEVPPVDFRGADGRVHLRWGFYRNERECSTFNVEPIMP